MRAQGERGHHGNPAQKKYNVPRVIIRQGTVEIEFVVSPLELPDHPKRAAHCNQHPKKIPAPLRSPGVQEETGIGKERDDALRQICESGEAVVPARKSKRKSRVKEKKANRENGQSPNCIGKGHRTNRIYSKRWRIEEQRHIRMEIPKYKRSVGCFSLTLSGYETEKEGAKEGLRSSALRDSQS